MISPVNEYTICMTFFNDFTKNTPVPVGELLIAPISHQAVFKKKDPT